jgi:hypothetical protein
MSPTEQEQALDRGGGRGDGPHPKQTSIVVNGRPKTVEGREISYEQVVPLGLDPVPTGPMVQITVTFAEARGNPQSGTLTPGHSVEIRNGTRFHVKATDKS